MAVEKIRRLLLFFLGAILLGGLAFTAWLVQQQQTYRSKADVSLEPVDVHVTNVSESSFTVSWLTPAKEITGVVAYGTDPTKLEDVTHDVRGTLKSSKTHYVVLEKLKPATTYYFKIISGGEKFKPTQSSTTTFSALATPPSPSDPLFGKTSIPESIVYLYLQNDTTPIASSLSTENSTWTIDVSALRPQGGSYYIPNPNDPIRIVAKYADNQGETAGKLGDRQEALLIVMNAAASSQTSSQTQVTPQQANSATPSSQTPPPIPPTSSPSVVPTGVGGRSFDLNGDGKVDASDLDVFKTLWVKKDPRTDINGDGVINSIDYSEMAGKITR